MLAFPPILLVTVSSKLSAGNDRRARVEDTRMQQQWVADFAKSWDPYDWTKQLG